MTTTKLHHSLTIKQGLMAGAFLWLLLSMCFNLTIILRIEDSSDHSLMSGILFFIITGIPFLLLFMVESLLYAHDASNGWQKMILSGKHNMSVFFGTIISIIVQVGFQLIVISIIEPTPITDFGKAIIRLGTSVILFIAYYALFELILKKQLQETQ